MKNKKIILVVLIFVLINSVFAAKLADTVTRNPNVDIFLFNQNPDPARAGDILNVRVKVQNNGGGDATPVWIEFVPEYPFLPLSNSELSEDTRQIIEVLPCCPEKANYKILDFKLKVDKDVLEGKYKAKFRASSNTGYSWTVEDFDIGVTTYSEMKEIHIDTTKLLPGKETELTFTINNIGNAHMQNLIFSWDESTGVILPVGSDNTRYINFVDPGESIPLKYTVIASINANPDLYALNLNLEFDKTSADGVTRESVTTKSGIFVGGETDFDVTFSESSAGQTSLSIANVGSTPALSVTVKIPEQENFRIQGSNNAIVGNLDKGDYTIVSFQLMQSNGFGGMQRGQYDQTSSEEERAQLRQQSIQQGSANNNLNVLIDYTDTTGKRQRVEKTVSIQFRATTTMQDGMTSSTGTMPAFSNNRFRSGRQQTTNGLNWTLIISALFVLLIITGFVYYPNKKKVHVFIDELFTRFKK